MIRITTLLGLVCCLAAVALAEDPPAPEPQAEAPAAMLGRAIRSLESNDLPGAVKLLTELADEAPERSLPRHVALVLLQQVRGGFAERQSAWLGREVVDTVVLVPDELALIEAVGQWTDERFWPVLIEDAWHTPMFIEAFKPRTVVRWTGGAAGPLNPAQQAKRVGVAIAAHNQRFAKPADDVPAPPGIVVIDPYGPQRAAGYALAVGRGQPVLALRAGAQPNGTTSAEQVEQLNTRVMAALAQLRIVGFGEWSAVTLAGEFPYKYKTKPDDNELFSVDDRLGRDPRLIRYAVNGRLIGSPTEAVYDAMGSLFLQPDRALLFNTYGHNHANPQANIKSWHHLVHAADRLGHSLGDVTMKENEASRAADFRELTRNGEPYDLVWINSAHGGSKLMTREGWIVSEDMPIGHAYAMYMVASFGAANPWSRTDLITAARQGGAYWYFGSVYEPYLNSFVQATAFAHRAVPGTPLAFAAHQVEGEHFSRPWRLTCIGDPLFALRDEAAERVDGPDPPNTRAIPETPADDAAPAERVHLRVLRGQRPSPDDVKAMSEAPGDLSPDQLARLAWELYRLGDMEGVARIDEALAQRHTAALMLRRRAIEK